MSQSRSKNTLAPNVQTVPVAHKSGMHMTVTVRDVGASLPSVAADPKDQNVLVAYKDLNQTLDMQLRRQKQQLLFAFSFFLMMGLFILAGQTISKNRTIASVGGAIKVDATPVSAEHYQFDKNCYKGDDGEKVCVTRTSEKK